MSDDIHISFMKQALMQAEAAAKAEEPPIGAVITVDGKILSSAHNTREASFNPLDHAEIRVIRAAAEELKNWRLNECTLYVTLEPCPMCLGALLQARVGTVVFGAADPKREGHDYFPSLKTGKIHSNNHSLSVIGGVLSEECAQILKDFFKARRGKAPDMTVSAKGGSCGFPNDF